MKTETTPAPMTGQQFCTCHGDFTRTDPGGRRFCGYCYLPKATP